MNIEPHTIVEPRALVNFRDLGGIAVSGGTIRRGVLFRSDDVSTIPQSQARELVAAGLRTVIDLRSGHEADHTGRGPLGDHPVEFHHLPLTDEVTVPTSMLVRSDEPDSAHDYASISSDQMGTWYAEVVTAKATTVVRALNIIADSTGALIFHCAAGKDRTGVLAACILSVLGAAERDIVRDYARTHAAMNAIIARLEPVLGAQLVTNGTVFGGALMSALPANMTAMFEKSSPTSIARKLRAAGLDGDLINRLNARLVQE